MNETETVELVQDTATNEADIVAKPSISMIKQRHAFETMRPGRGSQ